MIAAVCGWHERHAAVAAEIEKRLKRDERLAVSASALVESYAVLTRLPAPHRLSAADAWALIESNFVKDRKILVLTGAGYVALLSALAKAGIGGGRTYDALIAECAREAKADTLLTLNRRHFESLIAGVAIVDPVTS
jgi:predicted nucleic acid-binding protein